MFEVFFRKAEGKHWPFGPLLSYPVTTSDRLASNVIYSCLTHSPRGWASLSKVTAICTTPATRWGT